MSNRAASTAVLLGLTLLAAVGASALRPARVVTEPIGDRPTESVRRGVVVQGAGPASLEGLSPVHREMVERLLTEGPGGVGMEGWMGVSACFAEGTTQQTMEAFFEAQSLWDDDRFFQNPRWGATAFSPAGSIGDPIILTYSFVPDGTFVPGGVGEPGAGSDLFAFMNGIYGSPAVWQGLYAGMFARWSEVSGITFIYEPNDDGASFPDAPGVAGVRGDLRMAGKFIDGNSGVLAYNYYPQFGDMVIDTGDNFYFDTSNGSLRLRNVLSHEHGHGMGQRHVCPVTRTKLMEPTVTTLFDGPRHDDIRSAQRYYGDIFEPDNTPGQATDLGVLSEGPALLIGPIPPPEVLFGSVLSLHGSNDQDYFRFSVADAQRVTVTVTPIGLNYDDSPQSCSGQPSSCCSGLFTDSLRIADLAVQVIDGDGVTVLATADGEGLGEAESAAEVLLGSAGEYFIRVYPTNLPAQSQLYHIGVEILPSFLGPRFALPDGAPTIVEGGVATAIDVVVNENDDALAATPLLFYRSGPGAFASAPLSLVSGSEYTATIPAQACDSALEYYLQGEGVTTGVFTLPAGGAADPFSAVVGTLVVIAEFDFESAPGWTVENDPSLTDGAWDRGVPVNCNRGDPPTDFDGSGQCFLTDNSSANSCNSDVDDGATYLISPVFDITALPEAELSYARWYSNTFGASPQADVFVVEVSSDGGQNWVNLETVGPSLASPNPEVNGGWFHRSFRISDFVAVTDSFRVRFIASDFGAGSVVEAAVDAFRIGGLACTFVAPECAGDANSDGVVDFNDITTILSNWLNDYTPGTGQGDANGDGVVDFNDITAVLSNWLEPCE